MGALCFLRAPAPSPPAREPTESHAARRAYPTRKAQLDIPTPRAPRRVFDTQQHHEESLTARAAAGGARSSHARVDAWSRARGRIHEELHRHLRPGCWLIGEGAAGERERHAHVVARAVREGDLRSGKRVACDRRRGTETPFSCRELLRMSNQREKRRENGDRDATQWRRRN